MSRDYEATFCIHGASGVELYEFDAPYLGKVRVCWDCRRELALRTMERPMGMVPLDGGRIGYECSKCKGVFTSDDPMSCTCRGRKAECAATRKALKAHHRYSELTNTYWKPKQKTVKGNDLPHAKQETN